MQEKINLMIKLFLIKNDTQESIEIHNNTTTIGREASNEIVLASSYISKYHCKLTKKENQWLISDLQSTNGTFLNSERLTRTTILRNNDVIMFGSADFTYNVKIENNDETSEIKTTIINNENISVQPEESEKPQTFSQYFKLPKSENNDKLLYILIPSIAGIFLIFLIVTSVIGYVKNPKTDEKNVSSAGNVIVRNERTTLSTGITQNQQLSLPEKEKMYYIEDFITEHLIKLGEKRENITTDMITRTIYYMEHYRQGQTFYDRIEKRKEYIKVIEEELKKVHLPLSYSFIPFVESGYETEAYNKKSGARGMWQFLPATAKEYGLTVNRNRDDRTDARASAKAAAKYLTDMCAIFGNDAFLLVTASFNCGDGRLRSALKEANTHEGKPERKRSFFYLYDKKLIPPETRDYVFKVVAAILLTEYLKQEAKTEN